MPERPSEGDPAPRFALTDRDGSVLSLDDLAGRRVLLFFYPKAGTPGCTTQACGLRDVLDDIGGTAVVGISPDPPAEQAAWADANGLGFPLLSDPDHRVAEAYGVWGERSMYGRTYMGIIRSSFLIGPDGRIERAWHKISPKDTPKQLLRALAG